MTRVFAPDEVQEPLDARLDFYARGDGVTDDTAALKRGFLKASSLGRPLYIPKGTYLCTDTVTPAGATTFDVYGEKNDTILLHQAIGKNLFSAQGATSGNVRLAAPTAVGDTQITVASTSGWAAGDFLLIRDVSQTLTDGAGDVLGCLGQTNRIKSVDSSTQVTLFGRCLYAYTSNASDTSQGRVNKITMGQRPRLRNLTIKNPTLGSQGQNTVGAYFLRCWGVEVSGVTFIDMEDDQINLDKCVDFMIRDNFFLNARNDLIDPVLGDNPNPYNVRVTAGSSVGRVSGNIGRYGRHFITSIGESSFPAQPPPQFVAVSDNTTSEYSSAHYDTHNGASWWTFDGNMGSTSGYENPPATGDSGDGIYKIRGTDITINNPMGVGGETGIYIVGAVRAVVNGGKFAGCSRGAFIRNSIDPEIKGTKFTSPVDTGIKVGIDSSDTTTGLVLDDIDITGTPATAGVDFKRWHSSFRVGRVRVPSATTKMQGRSMHAIASAATITIPSNYPRVISITGTTGITSITADQTMIGEPYVLVFAGALTVTDGSNLKLNGNFVTTADDTLTVVCDGTNWYEIGRSAN